jgi:solute carrier family 35 (GDP-fucose transporter), member C1
VVVKVLGFLLLLLLWNRRFLTLFYLSLFRIFCGSVRNIGYSFTFSVVYSSCPISSPFYLCLLLLKSCFNVELYTTNLCQLFVLERPRPRRRLLIIVCWGAGEVADKMKHNDYGSISQDEEGELDQSKSGTKGFWHQFPKAVYKVGQGQRVFPLSVVFVGMITFNNLCLKWVEVSFYNVARSLTIVFNVAFSSVMLGSSSSTRVMVCLGIVILGFFMGSSGELNFSLKGTLAGILSSLFVSLNSIYTKKVLPVVDNDHWKLTFYNNVNACILFMPLILIFEHQQLAAAFGKQFLSPVFWGAMLVAGFFGFAIGIVTVLQIKATSPLSHNISGTAKAAVQSMLAFYIWKNPATVMGVLGIFVVLGGSLAYTFVKMEESKMLQGLAPPPPQEDNDMEMNRPLKGGVN